MWRTGIPPIDRWLDTWPRRWWVWVIGHLGCGVVCCVGMNLVAEQKGVGGAFELGRAHGTLERMDLIWGYIVFPILMWPLTVCMLVMAVIGRLLGSFLGHG